jgi:hypothetical protein
MKDKILQLKSLGRAIAKFSDEEKKFRICAMQEELDKYKEATSKEDELDALVDLVVFALGTAERQGMLEVFTEAYQRVMVANCQKEIGQNQKRGSFQLDLVKPKGWTAPDLSDLVKEEPKQMTLFDYIDEPKQKENNDK